MKSPVKLPFVLAALGLTLASTPNVLADTFSFEFSTPNPNGSTVMGTLVGDLVSPGEYAITSGSVTLTDTYWPSGDGVYSVVPDPSSPTPVNSTVPVSFFTYDDLLFPGAPDGEIVDGNGLYFYDSSLGLAINIWGNGASQPYTWELADSGGYRDGGSNGTVTAQFSTPEPGSLMLLGTILLLALTVFRNDRKRTLGF